MTVQRSLAIELFARMVADGVKFNDLQAPLGWVASRRIDPDAVDMYSYEYVPNTREIVDARRITQECVDRRVRQIKGCIELTRDGALDALARAIQSGIAADKLAAPYGWVKDDQCPVLRFLRVSADFDVSPDEVITLEDVAKTQIRVGRSEPNVVKLKDTTRKFPENRELYAELEAVLDKQIGVMSVPAVIGILELLKQGVMMKAQEGVDNG